MEYLSFDAYWATAGGGVCRGVESLADILKPRLFKILLICWKWQFAFLMLFKMRVACGVLMQLNLSFISLLIYLFCSGHIF